MDSSRTTYIQSKERNEETLLRIQRLEQKIIKVQQEIRDKKKRATCLRIYYKQTDQQTQRQHAYQALMPPLDNNNNNNSSLPWLLNNDSQLLQKQRKQSKETHNALTLIQDLCQQLINHEAPNPKDIETLLSMTTNTSSFFEMIKHYLRRRQQQEQQQQQLEISTNKRNDQHSIEKERDDSMSDINKILSDQTNDIKNIKEECYLLETRMSQLEQDIRKRIRKLYPDISVQSTLLKRILTEAENQNMIIQRKTIQEQANALQVKAMALNIKDNSSSSSNTMNHTIKYTVDQVIRKQNQIAHLMALVQMTPSKLEEQRDKFHQEEKIKRKELLEQLQENCNELHGSVQRKIDVFHRLPLSVGSNDAIKTTKDSTRLEQIKDCFHPYLRLSRQGIIDQLGQILIRVNTLAISNPPEIQLRETLESFATQWQQELDQDNIYIEESRPREDAVDSITKLANALKKHNRIRQSEFVIKQEKLLRSKLNILQQSNKEVLSIMDAIEERQYIEEGTIGLDYTYQDKTLQEWISFLSKNNNDNNNNNNN